MDEQHFNPSDFVAITLFLGSAFFLLGMLYQLLVSLIYDRRLRIKHLILVIATRVFTIPFAFLLWSFWPFEFTPILEWLLLPAGVAELVLAPLFLRLFGYKVWVNLKNSPSK